MEKQPLVIEYLTGSASLPGKGFLSRISDLAWQLSADGREVRLINARSCEYLGWTATEIEHFTPWWDYMLSSESAQSMRHVVERLVRERTLVLAGRELPAAAAVQSPLILSANSSAGLRLPVELHTVYVSEDGILILARSPLHQDSAEEILRQTQARFRSIVDSLSINLVLKGMDGRRIYANRAYLQLRNYKLADIIGKTDSDLFPPDLAAQFQADDQRVLQTGEVIHKFEENFGRDGQRTWSEIIKGPLRDADNNISGVQILFWDASARKATEAALERERHLLHTLLDNVPDSIYFKDQRSRFLRISRGMANKFNLTNPEVAIGKTDADIFTVEHAAQAREDELRIMRTGQPLIATIERETWPNRPDTWCSTTKLPLYDPSGRIVGTCGISRDITELIRAEQALRDARDAADRANASKSQFLANMSHEIRTPMNGIIGMTELLSHTPLQADQRSFVDMIEQSAQSLLRIINDILDFSKIEAGKLDLEIRPFDLHQCVSYAAKSLAVRAAQKQLELVLEMSPNVPVLLLGDADRLRQILVNLVGNAIKFTSQGAITIRVAVSQGPPEQAAYTLHFSVKDTGIGIPADKQHSIFEAFSQADVSTTRQYGGTGLGLSISSQLVAMMGGQIWLESQPGIGSTFHFTATFPASLQPASKLDSDPHNTSLQGFHRQIAEEHVNTRQPGAAAPRVCGRAGDSCQSSAAAKPVVDQAAGLRLLLAEDGVVNAAVFKGLLERDGHQVWVVEDGQAAIEAWQEGAFDAILMDVQMPRLDGLDATRAIRQAEATGGGHIPIIAITAAAMEGDQARCLEAGMDDYLSKPIDLEQFRRVVDRIRSGS
jgi:two-component system, sensor histidine kinase and response regulator